MWPATARIVASERIGRVQLCTGPGFTGPQSRCSRSAVAGSSAKRFLRSATATVRLHRPLVRLSRQGSSTGAGSSMVCSGVRREPLASDSRSRTVLRSGPVPASRL